MPFDAPDAERLLNDLKIFFFEKWGVVGYELLFFYPEKWLEIKNNIG
jgi:hypothetical protein